MTGYAGGDRLTTRSAGVALMMVLWVLVMLSVIALHFVGEMRFESQGTRNFREETLARALAMSWFQETLAYLLSDKDVAVDFVDADGRFWSDAEREPVAGKRTTDAGEMEITVTDEGGRINLNFADADRLQRVFAYAGVPQDDLAGLADSVLDWRDPDTAHRLSGAEDDYYKGLDSPYSAKNGPFDVPEELGLVKGMTTGSGETPAFRESLDRLITTFGKNTLNINTASREVMEAVGLNELEIEAVMKQRTKEVGGFRFVPPQFAGKGFNALAAQTVRIDVSARLPEGKIRSHITATVERRLGPKGFAYQTISWRERVETVGS